MKKIIITLIFMYSIHSFGQPTCSGDACGSISVTNSSASGIPTFTFKNNNKRKIRLFIKTFFLGGGCTDPSIYDLAFGESKSVGGALCDPYTANFIDPPPTTTTTSKPPVVYATPKIENGNYRIRNTSTGKYLKSIYRMENSRHMIIVDCDSITNATDNSYKWTINVISRSIAGSKTEETYEIKPKCDSEGPSLTPVEISDFHPPYYCTYHGSPVVYHLDYSIEDAKMLTGGYICTLTTFPNSLRYKWDNPIMQWEFVNVAGSNNFQIKGNQHYYFLTYKNEIKSVRYEQIVGNPLYAQWHLERCE